MSRRGVALPVALLALVVAAALATAALAAGRLRYLTGHRRLALAEASAAASGTVEWWRGELSRAGWTDTLAIGRPSALSSSLPLPGRLRTRDTVVRLGPNLLLVRSTGERIDADGSILAREELEGIIRIAP